MISGQREKSLLVLTDSFATRDCLCQDQVYDHDFDAVIILDLDLAAMVVDLDFKVSGGEATDLDLTAATEEDCEISGESRSPTLRLMIGSA
ncbi:hypothetical protein LOK49_LG05G02617 [Camellia lanceoleosa]|uniref:Uncharacterized protein n=1 Tax=Camellia lanceoleosa TaxID=1840588 RepID=A0ACC0HQJ8_9ERIC|nr:hypothetical protein LOK49_LG05G02617 [Camellia lanceoleosa]